MGTRGESRGENLAKPGGGACGETVGQICSRAVTEEGRATSQREPTPPAGAVGRPDTSSTGSEAQLPGMVSKPKSGVTTDSDTQTANGWFGLNPGVVILLAIGFVPLLVMFVLNLWSRPHYQFFPLALAGAAFLAWTRLQTVEPPLAAGRSAGTALFVGLSLAGLLGAVLLFSPWLACFAAMSCFMGLAWRVGGASVIRALLPALAMVLTIMPLPLNGDQSLMLKLRSLAVASSSRLLDSLDVVHLLSGNVIELPRQKLLVEEACSGINSVLLTLAVCLFYLLWRKRSVWWILVCLVSTLVSVVLGNIFRITLGAWIKYRHNYDILSGWRHELVGLALLAFYLLLIVSLDQFLEFLTHPIPEKNELLEEESESAAEAPTPVAPPTRAVGTSPAVVFFCRPAQTPVWWWGVAGAFALLALVQVGLGWKRVVPELASASHLRPGATFSMPEEIDGWKRMQSDAPVIRKIETAGVFSQVWNYRRGGVVASVALDYPFRGYHDVTICYGVAGWSLTRLQRVEAGTNSSPPFVEVEMQKSSVTHGALWFSTVDERGRWMEQPEVVRRFLDRWWVDAARVPTSYRIQVLVTGYSPLSPAERAGVQQLFESVRSRLARQVLDQLQTSARTPGGAP